MHCVANNFQSLSIQESYEDDPKNIDPFERFNRGVFNFNQATDHMIIRPITVSYHNLMPKFGRQRVHNFFTNLTEPVIFLNGILQLNPKICTTAIARLFINTFLGILGINDVAGEAGLKHINNGFGDTLAHYGFKTGPYLVLPIVGSSSVRGAVGFGADIASNPFNYIGHAKTQYVKTGGEIIDTRSKYLEITDYINDTAFDKYATYRSLYLQEHKR